MRGNRKLFAAWILTVLATSMLVLPSLLTSLAILLNQSFVWSLIGEATWAATISLVWGAYFGASVAEKHRSFMPDGEYNNKYCAEPREEIILEEEF